MILPPDAVLSADNRRNKSRHVSDFVPEHNVLYRTRIGRAIFFRPLIFSHRCPNDISGQRFYRLTAEYMLPDRGADGSVIWHCRCDCGNEIDVVYNNLVHCNMKSCGCQKKEHDKRLQSFLTHVAGTSVDAIKSKKVPTDNTTGYKGVYLIRGKYVAKIVFQKKQYFLGTYGKIEDAVEARKEAEEVLFDGVAEHYRKWKEIADTDPEWAEQNPVQVIVNKAGQGLDVMLFPEL